MLELPGQPTVDKHSLVGGCLRLPIRVDAKRLRAEVAVLPSALWGTAGGRVGVHGAAEALFLRGTHQQRGEKPIEDRAPLELLPYAREIIERLIPAPRAGVRESYIGARRIHRILQRRAQESGRRARRRTDRA